MQEQPKSVSRGAPRGLGAVLGPSWLVFRAMLGSKTLIFIAFSNTFCKLTFSTPNRFRSHLGAQLGAIWGTKSGPRVAKTGPRAA